MTQSSRQRWNELWTLFGAYLNQDFPDEFGTPENTIQAFKKDSAATVLDRTATQARDLARSTDNEQELRRLMIELGIEYMPWADGWDSHAWLEHLADTLHPDPS